MLGLICTAGAAYHLATAPRITARRAPRRAPAPTAQFDAIAKEAMRKEMELQQMARIEEARAELERGWQALSDALPAEPTEPPKLTLYRDTNGWCPFCERVWLQLEAKGIPYDEVLIDLRDKPEWYKEIVPTTLVPAIKLAGSGEVVWESRDIMERLEVEFPSTPLLPADGTAERASAEEQMNRTGALLQAGVRLAFGARNTSLTDAERAAIRSEFEEAMDGLDADIAAAGGPFMAGERFSLVDAMYVPMMERWAVQLPLSHGVQIRPPDADALPPWPAVEKWYQALEALPYYARRVRGDEYSWAATVGTFQRMFAANSTAEPSDAVKAATKRADAAAAAALRAAPAAARLNGAADAAAVAAARKLIANRAAIVADATATEAKSQPQLTRLEPADAPVVESVLQSAVERLVGTAEPSARETLEDLLEGEWAEADVAARRARAAKFVASRLCVPRDLGMEAGARLRATLLAIAREEEAYAWSASGGLL